MSASASVPCNFGEIKPLWTHVCGATTPRTGRSAEACVSHRSFDRGRKSNANPSENHLVSSSVDAAASEGDKKAFVIGRDGSAVSANCRN